MPAMDSGESITAAVLSSLNSAAARLVDERERAVEAGRQAQRGVEPGLALELVDGGGQLLPRRWAAR